MRSKKVLISLIVAAFVGGFNVASAQTKANYQNNLIEIGPDNIGGRVRAIVVDQSDSTHTTLYAGGVAGGLFKKTGSEPWQYLTYNHAKGSETTLNISYMIQLPDNTLLIATGEGIVENHGLNDDRMAPKGRGLYRFNPADGSFSLFTRTNPETYPEWTYINRLAAIERNGDVFVYAATNEGLYRWKFNGGTINYNAAPTLVKEGNFQDVIIISSDNVAYASCPGKLYRIGNVVNESAAIDITSANSAFASSKRIELAALTEHKLDTTTNNYVHTTSLYAIVIGSNGLLEGVYLTTNQQTWNRLSTSSVTPFTSVNPGNLNTAITIDPRNHKRIIIGGATLWMGQGYLENSLYQWTKSSYSEEELNGGNYMGMVFTDSMFCHSGIHQIVANNEIKYHSNGTSDTTWVYYIATDGGIFRAVKRGEDFSFRAINKGFNTVQFNSVAVAPDGSIIGGAIDNSCPFIQSRNDHNAINVPPTNQWYDDDPSSIMNHMANILWTGNGGYVEASMFQQVLPKTHRGIFVSAEPGHFAYAGDMGMVTTASYARAYNDYADYTQTQTWTVAEAFLSEVVPSSNPVPQIKLWETDNNTSYNDSITFTLDTMGVYFHNGVSTPLTGNTVIEAGDQVIVPSPAHFNYPFRYTFNESFTAKNRMTHHVHNPIANRIIVNGRNNNGAGIVAINFAPTDYRKRWDINESGSDDAATLSKLMNWSKLYQSDAGHSVGSIAWSLDGDAAFAVVTNDTTGESFIMRVYNITAANANDLIKAKDQLDFVKIDYPGMSRVTLYDTIFAQNGERFKRPITNLEVDQRPGHDMMIVTFGGYDTLGEPNMVIIENPNDKSTRRIINMHVMNESRNMTLADPVYSALIEYTTGRIYAGTEKGVFTTVEGGDEWFNFGSFDGVPVTSIRQQTRTLQRQRFEVHEGINTELYIFAKTKYPYAIYFGTYGRGVFMDTTYVTDHRNEVVNDEDFAGITNVDKGDNRISIYPNPSSDKATIDIAVAHAGNAVMKIYDVNGRMVVCRSLGYLAEGVHQQHVDVSSLTHGMYLVNITFGNQAATSKLIVR